MLDKLSVLIKFNWWFKDCLYQSKISYKFYRISMFCNYIISPIHDPALTENQNLKKIMFFLVSARSDLSFIERFNITVITVMIDDVSTS